MSGVAASITERVARGQSLLDVKDPGWWRADADPAINLAELSMSSPRKCVLGQRCPLELRNGMWVDPFWAWAYVLAGADGTAARGTCDTQVVDWAAEHGFTTMTTEDRPAEMGQEFAALGAEWTHLITERRSAVQA